MSPAMETSTRRPRFLALKPPPEGGPGYAESAVHAHLLGLDPVRLVRGRADSWPLGRGGGASDCTLKHLVELLSC